MKKTLLGLAILSFIGLSTNGAFAGYYYQAPNAGNMSFYPMMQRQMEQQETLDFVNHPEEYKEKRAKKRCST